jgi:hypothetical protein
VDLGTDFGVAPVPSETPRAYAGRLRSRFGEPGGMDAAAHRAVGVLTSDFERYRYGRPQPAGPNTGGPGRERQDAGGVDPAEHIGALELALRCNATRWQRFRAAWLPPSVMGRLGRMVAAPFRAAGRLLAATAKAASRALPVRSR